MKRFLLSLLMLGIFYFPAKADIILSESFSTAGLPAGWTSTALQGSAIWTIRNSPVFGSPSGGYYAVFDDDALGAAVTPNEAVINLPSVNCTGRTDVKLKFSHFWYGVENTHGYVEISVNGGVSWTILKDYHKLTRGSLASAQDTTFDITAIAANQPDVRVRFRYTDGLVAGKYWYLDDVMIYSDPDVGITALIDPPYLGCAQSYTATESVTVEITNHGINPVSNIPVTVTVTGGTSATLSGIFAGPLAGGATVNFTLPGSINMSADAVYDFLCYTTLAGDEYIFNDTLIASRQQLVTSYPYAQNFNTSTAGWTAGSSIPYSTSFRRFTHGNLPYLNGPQGNGNSWYVEANSNTNGAYVWVESPVFDFTGMTNPQLIFDIKHSLHSSDYFHVEYSTNGGTNWYQVGNGSAPSWYNNTNWWQNSWSNPVDVWTQVQHSLCPLAGQSCVKLRIYGRPYYGGAAYPNYYKFAFDNVRIEDGPDVGVTAYIEPTNTGCLFSATQPVTITVSNFGCAPLTNIPVTCEVTGAATTTLTGTVPGPIPAGGSVNYTFSGTFNMTNTGTYNFLSYTQMAGDVALTNDTLPLSLNVNQLKISTFPYTEDFNSGPNYWLESGNNPPLNNGRRFILDSLPYLNGPQGMGDSWYVESTQNTSADYIWVESPVFDFTNLTNPKLTMDVKHSLHSSDFFQVQYSIDGGNTWVQLGNGPSPTWYNNTNWWQNSWGTPVNTWTTVEQELCILSGEPCVKFRVRGRPYYGAPAYPNYYLFAFDNFAISAGEPDDIEPLDIILADGGNCTGFSSAEPISVVIKNNTCRPLYNVPISLQVNGGTVINEIMPGPIPRFGVYTYTFTATADLSAAGTHTLTVTTNLATDNVPSNDVLTEIRYNLAAINAFPYAENFNVNNGGWVSRTTDPNRMFHRDTIPYLNGPQGQGESWYVEAFTNTNGTWIWLESPVFDFSSMTNPQLFFDLKHSLHSSDYIHVEYSTNGGTSWTQLGNGSDPYWYNNTNYWQNSWQNPVTDWTQYQHSLCPLAGQSCVKLRFRGRPYYGGTAYPVYYNFAVDNIRIEDGPDVGIIAYIDPSNTGCLFATTQQVTVEVYNFGCQPVSNVPVTCNVTGAASGTLTGTVPGPIPAGGSVNYTFPGTFNMTATGMYNFLSYTQLPGDINPSNDTLGLNINVNQLKVTTFPYTEDFNSGPNYWLESGSNPPLNNGRRFILDSLPYLNGPQGMGDSWYVESTQNTSADYIWVESPVFDFTNLTNPRLTMDVKHSLHSSDFFQVQYSLDGGVTWAQLGNGPSPTWYNNTNWWQNSWSTPVNTWTTVEQELCNLSGEPCVKFRVRGRPYYGAPAYPNYYLFAFDNFSISAGEPDDIAPVEIILSQSGSCASFTSTEPVSVILQNNTCRPLYNVPISLQVNGGPVINEVVPGPVPRFGNYIYTFTATADLSATGTHVLSITTGLATDANAANDNVVRNRFNLIPVSTYPYSENFNADNGGWVSRTPDANRFFHLDTLPYLNGSQGNGDCWYVEAPTNTNGNWIWLESPVFDFSGLSSPQLYFDLKHSLHSSDYFHVEYSLNGGSTWTQLGNGSDPNWYNNTNYWQNSWQNPVNIWTEVQHSLCALAGQSCVKLRLRGRPYYGGTAYPAYYNFAVDNIRIVDGVDVGVIAFVGPTMTGCLYDSAQQVTVQVFNFGCAPVTNVPVNCTVAGPSPASFTGTIPGPIAPGASVNYTFPGTFNMTPLGTYDFTAWTQMAADLVPSNDTLTNSITVQQQTVSTFPYFEDFNAGNGGWLETGANPPLNNGRRFVLGALPYLNGPEGHGDSWYVETTQSTAGDYIWVESPVFDFTNVTNPRLLFDIKHSLHSSDFFHVEYSTNGGTSWTQLGTGPSPTWYNNTNWWQNSWSNPVDEWLTVQYSLCNLAGQSCVKFRMRGRPYYGNPSYPNYYKFAFDNIHITDTPIDAAITYITGCYGSQYNLEVTLWNVAPQCTTSQTINSITISYSIDGNPPVTQVFNGLNVPYDSLETIIIPNVTVPSSSSSIKVWCSLPNGLVDHVWENDTAYGNVGNWPNCNDHCSNAIQLGMGTTTLTQTSNATTNPATDPLFPCGNPTLENTVWYYFTTDSTGGNVTVNFNNILCVPSTSGIQVSINQLVGPPCDTSSWVNVYCSNNGNQNNFSWGPVSLPPNTTYYIVVDGYAGNDCDFEIEIIGAVDALPVTLTGFEGQCLGEGNIVLDWTTGNEQQSSHFVVERSADGLSFSPAGMVPAAGSASGMQAYRFEDHGLPEGKWYYRLQLVDRDGTAHASNVIEVGCGEAGTGFVMYPNPAKGQVEVSCRTGRAEAVNMVIYDQFGRPVAHHELQADGGLLQAAIGLEELAAGVYFVELKWDGSIRTEKLVIVK